MRRPIGVMLLAAGAGLIALFQLWRILVFLGIAHWTFLGNEITFKDPQWGQALWALILGAIWVWVAMGFWNVRAYAWTFGTFISLFTIIWGFMAILFNNNGVEGESLPILLSVIIYFYLNYPGVKNAFVENEMSRLTPEQRAAMEQLEKANTAAATAQVPGGTPKS